MNDDNTQPDDGASPMVKDANGDSWFLGPNGEPLNMDAAIRRMAEREDAAREREETEAKIARLKADYEADPDGWHRRQEAEKAEREAAFAAYLAAKNAPKPPKPPRSVTPLEEATRALVNTVLAAGRDGLGLEDVSGAVEDFLENNEGYEFWVYSLNEKNKRGRTIRTKWIQRSEMTFETRDSLISSTEANGGTLHIEFLGHEWNDAWYDYESLMDWDDDGPEAS
jgi:hypothetical protein